MKGFKIKTFKFILKFFLFLMAILIALIIWAYYNLKDDFDNFERIKKSVLDMNETELFIKYKTFNKEKAINIAIAEYMNKKLSKVAENNK